MTEELREREGRKENYRMHGFLVHQTTGHTFIWGPFVDGAVMNQENQGCLGRGWHQCAARGGTNFGKPPVRAHQDSPSSDGFSSSHHGKHHLQEFRWSGRITRSGGWHVGVPSHHVKHPVLLWKGKVILKTPKPHIYSGFSYLEKGLRRSWGAQSQPDSSGDQRGNAAFEIKMALLWKVSPLFGDVQLLLRDTQRRKASPLPAPRGLHLQFLAVSIKERVHAWPSWSPAGMSLHLVTENLLHDAIFKPGKF